ncbi:hypothetical protein F5Y16DRAFT_256285 [Xylariaceae sp. FL0255]|nr:hypothetical protein F5Y16DRAFT_256285 [Xylariaceae sp. FL0255]
MADDSKRLNSGPWKAAQERFLQDLSDENRSQFREWLKDRNSTTRIQDEVQQLEKKNQHISKLKPLVEGLQSLDSIISPLTGLDSHGIATLIWGSVKILMSWAVKAIEFLEGIAEFLGSIGYQLGLLKEYQTLFSKYGSERFNSFLEGVFSKYLFFCLAAKNFFESFKWYKSFRSKHKSEVSLAVEELKHACGRAVEEVNLVDRQSRAISDAQIAKGVKQTNDDMQELADGIGGVNIAVESLRREIGVQAAETSAKELMNFRSWVKVDKLDPESSLRANLAKRQALPYSGTWLFSDEKVRRWISSSTNSSRALWMKADAGFGKSILTSYLTAEIQKLYPTGVAYFFCHHYADSERSVLNIIRTWIWQLLSEQTIGGETVESHLTITPSALVDFRNQAEPSIYSMQRLLEDLFRQDKPTRLIVDGLDECELPTEKESQDWNIFFELLGKLPSQWKVLLVSRPNNWYNDKLYDFLGKNLEEKLITVEDNREDLQDFANLEIDSYSQKNRWELELKQKTRQLIFDKADGNMMWVSLLCATFDDAAADEIEEILNEPPEGVEGLYGRALKTLSWENRRLADKVRRALKWILCAYRPLLMKELEAILGINLDNVMKYVNLLVKIEGNRKSIRLVHASARDYLLSPEASIFEESPSASTAPLADIHAMILEKCLQYLLADQRPFVHVGPNEVASVDRFRQYVESEPEALLEYSSNGWIIHFIQVHKSPQAISKVQPHLQKFFSSEAAVVKWLQTFHFLWNVHAPFEPARRELGGLVFWPRGHADWSDYLMDQFPQIVEHLGWEDGGRYARWDRFMARQHHYTPVHPFSKYQSPKVLPALSVAAFFDYQEVVEALLAEGIDVNSQGPLRGTALHWAAAGGSCKAMRSLITAGANKEAQYGRHNETPIFRAIRVPNVVPTRPGTWPAARLLFDEKVSLRHEPQLPTGFSLSTALLALVEEGPDCPASATFAIDLFQRDTSQFGFYDTHGSIIHLAAWHKRPMTLKELLKIPELKPLINQQRSSNRLMGVLHLACIQDATNIAKVLIESGADPNLPCDLNSFSPLHFAVLAGNKTAEAILDSKPPGNVLQTEERPPWRNVGEPNNKVRPCHEAKQMPLHLAVQYNSTVNLKKFVDKGFAIDTPDGNGDTCLTIALANSYINLARRLLDLGADPSKVPRQLRVYLPSQEGDERLLNLRKAHWKPIEAYAYLFYLRIWSKKRIPIPIMDLILRFAGHTELLEMTRKGRMNVNDHITIALPRPYVMSPPIVGNASSPVQTIDIVVHSRDQGYANVGLDYSLSKVVTMDRALKMIHWQPEHNFGRNLREWHDHRTTINIQSTFKRTPLLSHNYLWLPY